MIRLNVHIAGIATLNNPGSRIYIIYTYGLGRNSLCYTSYISSKYRSDVLALLMIYTDIKYLATVTWFYTVECFIRTDLQQSAVPQCGRLSIVIA